MEDSEELKELTEKFRGDERFYDIEKINQKRKEQSDERERVDLERKVKAGMLESTWALTRLCKEIINESEGEWNDRRNEMEKNIEKTRKAEEKKARLEIVKTKKSILEKKKKQKRIDIMIDELSARGLEEWDKLRSELEKKERLEIRDMKENIWRWRTKENKGTAKEVKEKNSVEEKYERVKVILEKEKKEKKERIQKKVDLEEKWATRREEEKNRIKGASLKKNRFQETWRQIWKNCLAV